MDDVLAIDQTHRVVRLQAFLIGLRNPVRVMLEWMWYYLTFMPRARLLFEHPPSVHDISPQRHTHEQAVEDRSSTRCAA